MSAAIVHEGMTLALAVGSEEFQKLNTQSELNVQTHWEEAEKELQTTFDVAVEDIQQAIKEVFQGDLVQAFITYLENCQNITSKNITPGIDANQIKSQISILTSLAQGLGIKLTNLTTLATRNFLKTAQPSGVLRSIDVVGSELHQIVLFTGKSIGFKFQPWQAVNLAKNIGNTARTIGNAAKFLGPALAVYFLISDVRDIREEQKRQKEMADIRRDITNTFQSIAKDLEHQIEIQLYEFEQQVYSKIEKQISFARQEQEEAIATSNIWFKQLINIRKDFESILCLISLT